VFCENRKKTKPLPEVKKQFGYSEEIVTNDGTQIEYIKVSK
jgi:hypothetical protein